MNRMLDIGVAQKIGTYSDGVEAPATARWVFTAGTPGLMPERMVLDIVETIPVPV